MSAWLRGHPANRDMQISSGGGGGDGGCRGGAAAVAVLGSNVFTAECASLGAVAGIVGCSGGPTPPGGRPARTMLPRAAGGLLFADRSPQSCRVRRDETCRAGQAAGGVGAGAGVLQPAAELVMAHHLRSPCRCARLKTTISRSVGGLWYRHGCECSSDPGNAAAVRKAATAAGEKAGARDVIAHSAKFGTRGKSGRDSQSSS